MRKKESINKWTNGKYFEGIIWVRKLGPTTLLHEFIHHVFRSIGNHDGGTRLFFDFINEIYESVWGFIFHKDWRKRIALSHMKRDAIEAWNDWLNWQLCR